MFIKCFVLNKSVIIYGMKIRKNKGFTLVELLIVVAIIAIIAGIVLGSLSESRIKGRDASKIRSMNEVQKALGLYQSQFNGYPPTLDSLVTAGFISSVASGLDYLPLAPVSLGATPPTACPNYHLAVSLEKTNIVLDTDKDFTSPVTGAIRCYTGAGAGITGTDTGKCRATDVTGAYCYDITP